MNDQNSKSSTVPLRDLKPGQQFYAASDKKRKNKFIVSGEMQFNRGHGTATRSCINTKTGSIVSKSGLLKVVPLN